MSLSPGLLARGPWTPDDVTSVWTGDAWLPPEQATRDADAQLDALRERGSPAHDGLAARLEAYRQGDGRLHLELQPARWSLRLTGHPTVQSLSVLCAVRDSEGRWLAGRRAAWLASWAGRWALGAGGAVEVDEDPVEALTRELEEEWSVVPDRFSVEALAKTPNGLILLVGLAWLAPGAEVVADDEHDDYAWWPADVESWPAEADEPLRRMAATLA
jgi:8-oxo-dGTP diphosphatase